jgi:glyoxylase-like metal-dependent hydrolase (beta-lactamase superfamily II)
MAIRVDIISIGTLSRNLIWNETTAVRTAHATCTLIRAGKRLILIDPGLPAVVLKARLFERTGLAPQAITDVFLTHAGNDSVVGMEALEKAKWWCSEAELSALEDRRRGDDMVGPLVDRLNAAPDQLMPGVDLFPLAGFSAGTSGLLIAAPVSTTLITGPAVASLDHFLAGQVLPDCVDVKAAKESLAEVYEIADLIVPGYDNQFPNPRQFGG